MAKKHTLEKKKPGKKPPYLMPAPNDDAEAYGWSLAHLRLPAKDPETKEVWPGRTLFDVKRDLDNMLHYGMDANFVCPRYLQYMLDQIPEIKKGAEKVRAAGYSPEALEKFEKLIVKVFEEQILVDVVTRFYRVASTVAQFYAAKLAHVDTFGEKEDVAATTQIEAKTTKSRR